MQLRGELAPDGVLGNRRSIHLSYGASESKPTETNRRKPEFVTTAPRQACGRSAEERFLAKVVKQGDGCWRWTGATQTNGYGSFGVGTGKSMLAHRWSYEHFVGPILDGKPLDHLCRNRWCVNWGHLEPVSAAENTRRGESFSAQNERKTHCKAGHALDGENLIQRPGGRRACRECQRRLNRESDHRRRSTETGGAP